MSERGSSGAGQPRSPTVDIVVIVPVLARPHNAHPVSRSLAASTKNARVVFVCSPDDHQQIETSRATGCETLIAPWSPGPADWARKLELARKHTDEKFMLLGADDIRFHDGWAEAVLELFAEYDVGVVGTNDLANPVVKRGQHSTHPVVCRGYADLHGTIDEPELMLHQGYHHLFVDNELVETARRRGCWLFAEDAKVEHLHPIWKTADGDDTYELGSSERRADQQLYHQRRSLWR